MLFSFARTVFKLPGKAQGISYLIYTSYIILYSLPTCPKHCLKPFLGLILKVRKIISYETLAIASINMTHFCAPLFANELGLRFIANLL